MLCRVLLSSVLNHLQSKRMQGSPGVHGVGGECLYCQVAVFRVMSTDGISSSGYRCLTDKMQEGRQESEMSYSINFPSTFVSDYKFLLDSGVSTICIISGSAIRTEFGKTDYILIPPNADIHFVASRENRRRQLVQTTGNRTVLIVRVTAPGSAQSNTRASLANAAFGSGGQQNSFAAQYSACSARKLQFVAASGFESMITNGVIDLALPAPVNGIYTSSLANDMISSIKNTLGVTNLGTTFSNIMFCMPIGTISRANNSTNWVSSTTILGQYSYYNQNFCTSLSAKMHEIGHNLGLQHSSEDVYEYGDQSCMMGSSYSGTGSPVMCFNGHKNFVLGWYADKQITVNPTTTSGAWSGKLVGFVDYTKASTSRKEYVLIIVGKLYIQYNLAGGFNAQVKEKANLVTITTAVDSKSKSSMLVALSAKQFVVIDNYTIETCDIVTASSLVPKYVNLSVRLSNQSSTCPGSTLVTLSPSSSPIAMPTTQIPTTKPPSISTNTPVNSKPTIKPTPTLKPAAKPSTATPTSKPTAKLSIANLTLTPTTATPTAKPFTAKPTTATPTLVPSKLPSKAPTRNQRYLPSSTPSTSLTESSIPSFIQRMA